MIREKIFSLLLRFESLSSDDLKQELKTLHNTIVENVEKDVNNTVGDVLDDAEIEVTGGCLCMPSICIGNKCDSKIDTDVKL